MLRDVTGMKKKKKTEVSCPTCGKPVIWTSETPWRPFCSERCKLIDLGSWFDESNRIPGESAAQAVENDE